MSQHDRDRLLARARYMAICCHVAMRQGREQSAADLAVLVYRMAREWNAAVDEALAETWQRQEGM